MADTGAGPSGVVLYARALLFWTGLVLSTLVWSIPSVLITLPLPYNQRYRFVTAWTGFNLWWLRITCRLGYRVEGSERLPGGPAVALCKHQSTWETLALQRILPPQAWVLKRQLTWIPFFGWALAMLEPIAIDRGAGRRAVRQLVGQGKARLDDGRWVVIFPEGTRVSLGERRRYKVGGAILAAESGYPVVPIAHDAGAYWPRRQLIKRPGTVRVVIGPLIDPAGQTPEEINAHAEDWIEATAASLAARHDTRARIDS